ncbi:OsmC family protein [Aliikangiella coralliicola]|uniref:OsmC family protein n=1 Tax=Aliikangiella coralliicola TaxID=2592383 RepID=A0A545UHQ5_9GAMM|nr:OsmC family protein [Aliikangiella coralliicola]TQV88943.1 OsmC family protein [Aliikangiella coralliicola]
MKVVTQWQQGLTFKGTNEANQTITMDGEGEAPSPMHMILMAVGGCSSIDVVMILQKSRQEIDDCICELTAERAETDPKVFTKIHAHYKVQGKNLKQPQVERACNLSMEKYCSVSLMLQKSVEISHSFEIIETTS